MSSPRSSEKSLTYRPWLHRYAWVLLVAILLLIFVGGMVKSTDSGLSVPDWPNTYGHFMFSYPLDKMIGGILWEHSHRMIASVVGVVTFLLTWWIHRTDPRRWVRQASLWASISVLVQGVFGGVTVLLYLPAWASTIHGTLAQIYLGLVLLVLMATGKHWIERSASHRYGNFSIDRKLVRRSSILVGLILVQLLVGAITRHIEAGLVIPDFPTMFGGLIPPFSDAAIASANETLAREGILAKLRLPEVELFHMVMHFLHARVGALVVTVMALVVAIPVLRDRIGLGGDPGLRRSTVLSLLFLTLQITLGILTIYTEKSAVITSLHVLVGALLLSAAISMAAHLRSLRSIGGTSTSPEAGNV